MSNKPQCSPCRPVYGFCLTCKTGNSPWRIAAEKHDNAVKILKAAIQVHFPGRRQWAILPDEGLYLELQNNSWMLYISDKRGTKSIRVPRRFAYSLLRGEK